MAGSAEYEERAIPPVTWPPPPCVVNTSRQLSTDMVGRELTWMKGSSLGLIIRKKGGEWGKVGGNRISNTRELILLIGEKLWGVTFFLMG
jgi:hypothetical protein